MYGPIIAVDGVVPQRQSYQQVILPDKVKANTSIYLYIKGSVKANLKVIVKRVLREYGYPPNIPGIKEYTVSVVRILSQAELLTGIFNAQ